MTNSDLDEEEIAYEVVKNTEEQYSIWPKDREIPLGWQKVGKTGLKTECLEYIASVWEDMRPLSLRKAMENSETVANTADKQVEP